MVTTRTGQYPWNLCDLPAPSVTSCSSLGNGVLCLSCTEWAFILMYWFFCPENLCSGKKISAASIYFQSLPFKVHPETGLIDYEKLEETVLLFRPKILICGGSSYPREWDYGRFRQIANKVNAILMCDMAHISGLVAAEVRIPNPTCVVGPCIPAVDSLLVGL